MFTKLCMEAILKNNKFIFTKISYAWLQMLKRDLHGNENLTRSNIYLIFWDGNINVTFEIPIFLKYQRLPKHKSKLSKNYSMSLIRNFVKFRKLSSLSARKTANMKRNPKILRKLRLKSTNILTKIC